MSNDPMDNSTAEHQTTVEGAYRLKDSINRSITYGPGLNARGVLELKKLSAEQWAKVRSDYRDWAKRMQVFNNVVLLVIVVAGFFACVHYLKWNGWISWAAFAAGVMALCAVGTLFNRVGHREGYLDGYEAGFSDGI